MCNSDLHGNDTKIRTTEAYNNDMFVKANIFWLAEQNGNPFKSNVFITDSCAILRSRRISIIQKRGDFFLDLIIY